MISHDDQLYRIQVDAVPTGPVAELQASRARDDAFLLLEVFAFPGALLLAYYLTGSLRMALAASAAAYAMAASSAGRVRTARRRNALLATAALVLGPDRVSIDVASLHLVQRLDHYHRLVARVQIWINPSVAMFIGITYAYLSLGRVEPLNKVLLDMVALALLATVGAALLQFQSLHQIKRLTSRVERTRRSKAASSH